MQKLSLLEKLDILKDIISSSSFLMVTFFIVVTILIIMLKSVKNKKIQSFFYTIILGFFILKYGNTLMTLFDGMMDNIFSTIYFPTPLAYIVMFVLTNIIMIKGLISKKTTKVVKGINAIAFSLIVLLSCVTLDIIVKNNINIYSEVSMYTNTNLLATIELAMIIFAIWLVLLTLVHVIYKFTSRIDEPIKIESKLEERPIYHYDEPIMENLSQIPSKKEVYETIEKNRVICSNPSLYNESGNVIFPMENKLEEVYEEQKQLRVNHILDICQKDHLELDDYKELRNILIAVENNTLDDFELEKLVSIFE